VRTAKNPEAGPRRQSAYRAIAFKSQVEAACRGGRRQTKCADFSARRARLAKTVLWLRLARASDGLNPHAMDVLAAMNVIGLQRPRHKVGAAALDRD